MMSRQVRIVQFTPERSDGWDDLVERAPMATFLHSRRFLSYHGDRFEDASVVLLDEGDGLRGALPAALDPSDPTTVVSHPGATYGGLVHDGSVNGDRARDALAAICAHYAERGLTTTALQARPAYLPPLAVRGRRLGARRAGCDPRRLRPVVRDRSRPPARADRPPQALARSRPTTERDRHRRAEHAGRALAGPHGHPRATPRRAAGPHARRDGGPARALPRAGSSRWWPCWMARSSRGRCCSPRTGRCMRSTSRPPRPERRRARSTWSSSTP